MHHDIPRIQLDIFCADEPVHNLDGRFGALLLHGILCDGPKYRAGGGAIAFRGGGSSTSTFVGAGSSALEAAQKNALSQEKIARCRSAGIRSRNCQRVRTSNSRVCIARRCFLLVYLTHSQILTIYNFFIYTRDTPCICVRK